jgi:decaprenylphospho-beta-D-ribofuranose 2-oxidase
MNASLDILQGWGRYSTSLARVHRPATIKEIRQRIAEASPAGLITRGLGRSYGDAAQCADACVLDLAAFQTLELDQSSGILTAGAGASLDAILRTIVPAGFFLPVTPGTRNVTVGGAIAADVHGKNHHVDGSFGNHVIGLKLIDGQGTLLTLRPDDPNPSGREAFWATVGGMGLTGVIVEASFLLIPISSSLISVDTDRYRDFYGLMAAMAAADARYRYSVAWVDSLDLRGRGVLTCGDHAAAEQLPSGQRQDPLAYDPRALAGAPAFLPGGLLNTWTVRAFNETWYRKAPQHRKDELQGIAPYFHPLDGVKDWNRIYGPAGFLQYQFAVPDQASHLVAHTLETLRKVGAPSFLTVLKRLGTPTRPHCPSPAPAGLSPPMCRRRSMVC